MFIQDPIFMVSYDDVIEVDAAKVVKQRVLYVHPLSARYRILVALSICRGYRAYASSLLFCLDGEDRSDRRLHNTCVTLFKHGLVEKVRGMYQLTPAGLDLVVM